jgi:hypothetical protein
MLSEMASDLKETDFLKDLLETLVERGLGTLPARETALTFIELLLKHHPDWKDHPPEDYELARLLRTSPRKVRTIRDDLAYRDSSKDDNWCREKLGSILKGAERIKDGDYVTFQIDDGLLRDYAQKLVRNSDGVFEQGFSSSTVKISGKSFIGLAVLLLDEAEQEKLFATVPEDKKAEVKRKHEQKGSLKIFLDSFAAAAGQQAGKKFVDLGFTILSCGLSDVSSVIETVKEYFAE